MWRRYLERRTGSDGGGRHFGGAHDDDVGIEAHDGGREGRAVEIGGAEDVVPRALEGFDGAAADFVCNEDSECSVALRICSALGQHGASAGVEAPAGSVEYLVRSKVSVLTLLSWIEL